MSLRHFEVEDLPRLGGPVVIVWVGEENAYFRLPHAPVIGPVHEVGYVKCDG